MRVIILEKENFKIIGSSRLDRIFLFCSQREAFYANGTFFSS